MSKVILLTGASSGIGFDTARELARLGHTVYGAARRTNRLEELKQDGVIPLALDLTDEASMQAAVAQVIETKGRIDVLINNAGYGSFGAIEDVEIAEAKRQFEVNLFGLARLTQLVLPQMRVQGGGRIINTSSMGGRLTTFMGAWYHATKYALEAWSDALRMEVQAFGIDVVIIEPGGIKTEWGTIAAEHLEESARGGAYEKAAQGAAAGIRKLYSSRYLSAPSVITGAMVRAVEAQKPKTRYLVGLGAKPLVFLHAVLPDRAFDRMMRRAVR